MPKAAPKSQPTHEGSDRWAGFQPGLWQKQIDVRDFIQSNVTPYYGDELFLEKPTQRTAALWKKLQALFIEERKKGVLDVSPIPSSITAHDAGYIDKNNEIIVGLQTEAPLKRAIMPNGGFRLVATALKAYGYEPDPAVVEAFTKYRKTHNDAVFDAYSDDVRRCRSSHLLTGLPDAYGRGRIIGDYRRVALYGVDRLIARKKEEKKALDKDWPSDDIIRDREELAEQIRALGELKEMAAKYGYDISGPARTAKEAVQWLYFGYLASVKEQNGAAMSLGRTSTFLDIYFERDIHAGQLTEREAQEIVDDFVIKLRIVRFLRTPEYDDIFAGDPTWVTESIGGMSEDGRPLVTKTSFRYLQTLYNLGPAPEPNLTIWYTPRLPEPFRRFTAKVAIDTSSIQFESDETMRRAWGDDGGIACCVSPMMMGKQMQFFGARSNLAKCLLYAINGGRDEMSGEQIAPAFAPVQGEYLDFDDVLKRFDHMMDWLAGVYVSAMNVIHYMHDKYAYERIEMALHDYAPLRTMAFGIAGLSVVADSLSAIKHAKVKVIRDETGLIVDYKAEGGFPAFGNNDNRVDHLATWLVSTFMNKLRTHKTYRNAMHTQSVLTITSNVVYGRGTGNTPDGRRQGEPFAPGANPMHGRDSHGIHASAASVAKIPYRDAADGISLTTTVVPSGLGRGQEERISNLTAMLDAFFGSTGYHVNVNVLNREMLIDAMDHPERYPSLTIRVSGYAVNFVQLTREQQMDVITRTFHGSDVAGAAINTSGPPRARPVENRASRPEHKNGEAGGNVVKFPLEAESPYELRVGLAEKFSEKEMRAAVNSGDVGFLHSFTTGSAVDGPGVRLVAWTSLCMFRCQFCHNPDTWTLSNGMPVTISRASEELRKYAGGLKAMHGGFTLSGGEPFMQARFAAKLFAAAKWLGIHTAVETNGFYGDKLSDDELRNIDLVILDMKGFSQAQHQRVTAGIDNKPVHEFARRLSALKRPMWLRYVLVPGLTDVDEEMEQIAHFGASLGVVERVEILPFHQLGRYKWEKLGLDYRLAQTEPPSPASVRHAVDVFKAAGLNAS